MYSRRDNAVDGGDSHVDESTALLGEHHYSNQQEGQYVSNEETRSNTTSVTRRSIGVLALVCILLLLIDISGFLGLAPQTQIFEDIICQNYYDSIDKQPNQSYPPISGDERCKIEPIQSELAMILGYKDTLDQLPGIFFGVAYGLLADSIGRRPVLLFGMLGLALSGMWIRIVCLFPQTIPIKMVYLSSPILIFGGGAQVASSMLYVMLADSYPEEERCV
jgi:MFS family permease